MIINWLRRFMYGRHGVDQLSVGLLVLSIVLSFVLRLCGVPFGGLLYYFGLALVLFRTLSRKTIQRKTENTAFLHLWEKCKARFRLWKRMFQERNTHRYYKCPHCGQQLRVPKGKGKVSITCTKCKESFVKNT